MCAGAVYAWGWLKKLTRMEEQTFSKSTEPMESVRKKSHHTPDDIFWSFSDIFFITICFQIDIIYLCNMGYMMTNDLNPGFLQMMVMYVTWGPAIIYMEIFLGQYVQHGCLHLKNISPLTCSTIGYIMLLMLYFCIVSAVGRLADSYMFLFRSFSSELPWMACPKGSTPATCIDRALLIECYLENKRDSCYPNLKPDLLSSRIYYKDTHSVFANTAVLLFFGWLTIYIALRRTLSDTRIIVRRLLMFMLVLFVCLFMPLVLHVGRGLSIAPFFKLRHGAVWNIATWSKAFTIFLRDHATVRGGWQLVGCHIKTGPAAVNLTIYSCAITYLITILSQVFSTGILGVLIFYMKITHVDEELYFPKYTKLFNFYPFALGMLQAQHVWSLIFFTFIAFSSISFTVVNMAILEESMYDHFPLLLHYRSYVKVILCALGFSISTGTSFLTELNSYEDEVVLRIISRLALICILILTFSVGYIYGIERFSDDMNFLNGSQPTTYWKICWKSLPFGVLILLGSELIVIEFSSNELVRMMADVTYVILLGLMALHLLYQIVMSIKARNVAGMLFRATPLWGPPLFEDRRLRNIYNPREETNYWRRNNLCTHHCLLNKDFIFSIIFQEIDLRTSRARSKDTSQLDLRAVPQQSKQNQVVIAIDKVSSAELVTFEEEVRQKRKLLEQIEELELDFHRKQATISSNRITKNKSTEEWDYQIEQVMEEAERKAKFEKKDNITKAQITSSRMKMPRRLPTFIPKETPRPKKTWKIPVATTIGHKTQKGTAKVHTYAVQVPHFVLQSSGKVPQDPAPVISSEKRKNLQESMSHPPPAFCSILQIPHGGLTPKVVISELRLPIWSLPSDILQPTVSPRLSHSSLSSSSESKGNMPSKNNLPFPLLSSNLNSHSKSSRGPESSVTSLELSVLNHDPILREILHSVHPELMLHPTVQHDILAAIPPTEALGSRRDDISHSWPESRRLITRRLPLITSSTGNSCSPHLVPRKQKQMSPPVPSPRSYLKGMKPSKSAFKKEAPRLNIEKKIINSSVRCIKKETSQERQRTENEGLGVGIEKAIQIRIDHLLRGVRDPLRSIDQGSSGSPATVKINENESKTARRQLEFTKIRNRKKRTSQNSVYLSKGNQKLSDQSQVTSFVAAKLSTLGERIANKMMLGSALHRIPGVQQTIDENDKRSETNIGGETPGEAASDLTLIGCEDPEQSYHQ